MAGDWIKLEIATPDKPEIAEIAEILQIDEDAVLGKAIRFWIWADQQTETGHALSVTKAFLDRRIFFHPGFCDAMIDVGWIEVDQEDNRRLTIPDFDRHNGKTAKKRANTTKRKQMSRNCHAASVTKTGQVSRSERDKSVTREEKRREEKRIKKTKAKKEDRFDEFWAVYPKRTAKAHARKSWDKVIADGVSASLIIAQAGAYASSKIVSDGYAKNPATWLNGACWDDDEDAWNRVQNGSKNGQPTTFAAQRTRNTMEAGKRFLESVDTVDTVDAVGHRRSGGLIGMNGDL